MSFFEKFGYEALTIGKNACWLFLYGLCTFIIGWRFLAYLGVVLCVFLTFYDSNDLLVPHSLMECLGNICANIVCFLVGLQLQVWASSLQMSWAFRRPFTVIFEPRQSFRTFTDRRRFFAVVGTYFGACLMMVAVVQFVKNVLNLFWMAFLDQGLLDDDDYDDNDGGRVLTARHRRSRAANHSRSAFAAVFGRSLSSRHGGVGADDHSGSRRGESHDSGRGHASHSRGHHQDGSQSTGHGHDTHHRSRARSLTGQHQSHHHGHRSSDHHSHHHHNVTNVTGGEGTEHDITITVSRGHHHPHSDQRRINQS